MDDTNGEASRVLPADLFHVEATLRPTRAVAPDALLTRILESRAALGASGAVGAASNAAPSAISQDVRPSRSRLIVLAASVTIATLSMPWISNAPQRSVRDASDVEVPARYRDDVARLLQPFPSSAQAQTPTATQGPRAPRTTLAATAVSRLTLDRRIITRIQRNVHGQELSRTRREISVDTVWSNGKMFWLLTTRGPLDVPVPQQQIDSMVLQPTSLAPFRRRLRTPTFEREFHLSERSVTISDSIGVTPGCILSGTQPKSAIGYVTLRPCGAKPWIYSAFTSHQVDRRHTLALTEEHLALMLRAAPLSVGWQGTVVVPGPFAPLMQTFASAQVTLRVDQIDAVQTAKGAVPCYRVTIDYGARPDIWWISVATGEFIRGVRTSYDPVITETTNLEHIEPIKR